MVNSTITHHSEIPEIDEEMSLTPENLVVLTWLRLIHNDLPSLVKPYGSEFRSRSSHSCKKYVPQPMRRSCVLWHPNSGCPLQTFLTTHPNSPQQQAGRNYYNFLSGGQQISSGVDMAEAFNKYFYSTFTHAPEVPLDAFTPPDDRILVLDSLVLCEDEVYNVLLNIDPSKALGSDGLPTILLKTCARELTPLCALLNLSLAEGKIPTKWKDALVIPVHEKGKKEDVTNHTPISLLCIVSKVLERCIFKHLKDFLRPFVNEQHGFLQGRSTVTQLLVFYHEIGQSLDKGIQSDIAYLDLAKAFDSVSQQRLLLKLCRYGVSGKLLQWFESYLGGRGQQCLVHGFTYSHSPVPSGVPQGSIVGPLMFLVYVNNLPPVIQNRISLFADDSKCSSVIESPQDCESLQKALDRSAWLER